MYFPPPLFIRGKKAAGGGKGRGNRWGSAGGVGGGGEQSQRLSAVVNPSSAPVRARAPAAPACTHNLMPARAREGVKGGWGGGATAVKCEGCWVGDGEITQRYMSC